MEKSVRVVKKEDGYVEIFGTPEEIKKRSRRAFI